MYQSLVFVHILAAIAWVGFGPLILWRRAGTSRRMGEAADARLERFAWAEPAHRAIFEKYLRTGYVELAVLLIILALMVYRPGA